LETGALPIELLAYVIADWGLRIADLLMIGAVKSAINPQSAILNPHYLLSRWGVCLRQKRQNFANSSRSVVFFLFFVVL
jgi:hypothetical protein